MSPSDQPKRRWLRFSLRSLFLLVVVIAVSLACINKVRQQGIAVAALTEMSWYPWWGVVVYYYAVKFLMFSPLWLPLVFGAYAVGRKQFGLRFLLAFTAAEVLGIAFTIAFWNF